MSSLPSGSGSVCFDTTALIHFNAIGELDKLGEWFPSAFAPAVVIEEEIRAHLDRHPSNQTILDARWLEKVDVTEPDDLRDVAEIHRRFGRGANQDRGEAEVVVLCARHRWTGIIDDSSGQVAARDYRAPHCSILTMLLAATATWTDSARSGVEAALRPRRQPRRRVLSPHRAGGTSTAFSGLRRAVQSDR